MDSEIRIDPVPIISDDGFSVSANFANTGNADFNGCILLKLYRTGGQLMTKVTLDPSETLMAGKSFSGFQVLSSARVFGTRGEVHLSFSQ
jgi:hypothetical protein